VHFIEYQNVNNDVVLNFPSFLLLIPINIAFILTLPTFIQALKEQIEMIAREAAEARQLEEEAQQQMAAQRRKAREEREGRRKADLERKKREAAK